jgi:hypothetical protein
MTLASEAYTPKSQFRFYVGCPDPYWVNKVDDDAMLFISRQRFVHVLSKKEGGGIAPSGRKLQTSNCSWALDSGGFMMIDKNGDWCLYPDEYAREIEILAGCVGNMDWAASMDYMCEPCQIEKTGSTVFEHQLMTVAYYKELRRLVDPWIHVTPVLQGWHPKDYLAHVEMYAMCGVDLLEMPVVGVGSVCRRQDTVMSEEIFGSLHGFGFGNLHGFGIKREALKKPSIVRSLRSADSMAWSDHARRAKYKFDGCDENHADCRNCRTWALAYGERTLDIALAAASADTRAAALPPP